MVLTSANVSKELQENSISLLDFQLIKVIGSGSFGKVVLARQNGFLYALKMTENLECGEQ
jgi:serine/threonine protein kinase